MGFFDELDAVCNAQNAHLDQLFAQQQADAAATQAREEEEKKTKRRNWAVGVLEEGKISLNQVNKITSAMMIVVTDPEISCKKAEELFLKHDHYRPVIFQSLVEKFLERGGDPAGPLGMHCIKRSLSVLPGTDLFRDGKACESLGMALLVLDHFNEEKRVEIAKVYQLLRKIIPFTQEGNRQNIPHGLAAKLYPQHYSDGRCTYKFVSRHETGEARKVETKPRKYHHENKPEDPEITAAVKAAANGAYANVRLIRAS